MQIQSNDRHGYILRHNCHSTAQDCFTRPTITSSIKRSTQHPLQRLSGRPPWRGRRSGSGSRVPRWAAVRHTACTGAGHSSGAGRGLSAAEVSVGRVAGGGLTWITYGLCSLNPQPFSRSRDSESVPTDNPCTGYRPRTDWTRLNYRHRPAQPATRLRTREQTDPPPAPVPQSRHI